MSFIEQGFISFELNEADAQMRQQLAREFELARTVNAMSMRIVWSIEYSSSRLDLALGSLLYVRAVRAYQASLMLAWQGMCVEAQGLCRAVIECAIHIAKLQHDPDHARVIQRGHERHQITHAEKMLRFADRLDPEVLQRVRELQGQPLPEGTSINYEQLAKEVGLEVMYQALYRGTSGYAAHATLGALQTHLVRDGEGVGMSYAPQWAMLDDTLATATSVGLEAAARVADLLAMPAVTQECLDLALRLQHLRAERTPK